MNRERIIQALGGVRRYLFKALAVVVVAGIVSFIFSKNLIRLLLKAVNIQVYYLSFPEVFLATVEIAMYAGIFFALPLLIYLIWHEFRAATTLTRIQGYSFVFFAILLFYTGSVFCYYVVLPSGITFLLGYGTGHIKAMISVQRFVVFCSAMLFAFGVTFEVPIVLLILNKLGLVKSRMLVRTRRYAILLITIASALITPTPDVYNMMLLAVPTYVLFEIGILLMKLSEKKEQKAAGKEEGDETKRDPRAFPG
jgi:sec-independent protein translocase protein TatC